MPYTRAQLSAIMDKAGSGFVPRDKLPYAGRVATTLMLKRVYRWEDRAALDEFKLLKAAFADIREDALNQAARFRVDTLDMNSPSIQWRRAVLEKVKTRLGQLADEVALNAFEYASTAYLAGYYGRLWLLSEISTRAPHIEKISPAQVAQGVLHPALTEAVDYGSYLQLGSDWRDTYRNIFSAAYLKIASRLNTAQGQGQTVQQALQTIGLPLGMTSKPNAKTSAAYYQSQLQTRTAIMRSANLGGIAALQLQNRTLHEATDGWIVGVIWITAGDGRVCRICSSHDGQVFVINDLLGIALLGLPPDGSHWGCRCSYAPFLVPDLLRKDENPPEQTWDEWLDGWQVSELDQFMGITPLRSSVV